MMGGGETQEAQQGDQPTTKKEGSRETEKSGPWRRKIHRNLTC